MLFISMKQIKSSMLKCQVRSDVVQQGRFPEYIEGKKQIQMNKTFGGSPQCTEENMEYFTKKLKEFNDSNIKLTFRQWINRTMNLMDLID